MPLSIKNPEASRLAHQLSQRTGQTITEVVLHALREELLRAQSSRQEEEELVEDILAIGKHCTKLPLLDNRSEDEILGYNQRGIF